MTDSLHSITSVSSPRVQRVTSWWACL